MRVDPLGLLLAVGVIVSFVCAMTLLSGRAAKKQAMLLNRRAPLELMSASSALARADAAARRRSSAVAAALSPAGLHSVSLAGHAAREQDDAEQDRMEAKARAAAIAFHLAEHDPQRVAEVITRWIRTDPIGNESDNH